MPSYVLPQVLVFQEFTTQPSAIAEPQNVVIVGEQFDLLRYSDEKAEIKVADVYDPLSEQCFAWPGRQAGGVVDFSYTKVFFDDALLRYFYDPAGEASIIRHTGTSRNRIRAESKIWQTANGFSRSTELLRNVKIGDAIRIRSSACGSPVVLWSTIVGLIADTLAAIVEAATADAANQAALVAGTSNSQTAGSINDVGISSEDGSLYDGLDEGNPSETYTVEVVNGSVGGDATTALLRVTSASGNDDVSEVTPSAFGAATPVGSRGLTATFINTTGSSSSGGSPVDPDDFLVGQKWVVTVQQTFTPPVAASGGTYGGGTNTSYIVTVSRGGKFVSSVKPQITISTTTGVDLSGPTTVPASGSAVVVGTQGVTVSFTGAGLNKGDRYIIEVSAATAGPIRTLVLANNLPEGLRGVCGGSSSSSSSGGGLGPDLEVTLYIKKDIEVTENRTGFAPLINWVQSETEICIQGSIVAYDAEWASGGTLVALPVDNGVIYVQHRDRVVANCSVVGTISDIGAVADTLGTIDPDNPLAFGVFKALTNAAGSGVRYLGVCSSSPLTLENWLEALEILGGREDVYSLVPLTQDLAVLQAFQAHIEAQSTPDAGRWRIGWFNMAAEPVAAIYATSQAVGALPTDPVLATIDDDPDTSGTQYTLVEAVGEKFVTAGVRAGDTLRALYTGDGFGNQTYTEFVIDAVINEEGLRLVSGPSADVSVPSKIEIHRTLTRTELASDLATNPGLFSSRRIYLVWPDQVGNDGETFAGFYLCAALAGLRSSVLPHQGLTNVEIKGFDDLSRTTEFLSVAQQNTMAASGYWIVTQDPNDGQIFTRHQLSTGDQSNINTKEQNITTNVDNMSRGFLLTLKPFIGLGNVTPTMITILKGEIVGKIEEYKNTILVNRLGPQLISAEILELGIHPTLADRIVARISIDPPEPFNNLDLHLIV